MRPIVLAFSVGLALLAVAGGALGHAQFVSSDPPVNAVLPGAPSAVTLHVSEEASSASIRVTNCTGDRVDVNSTLISSTDARAFSTDLNGLTPGVFTVAWSDTSAVDGHFYSSSFGFAVQDQNGTIPCGGPFAQPDTAVPPPSPFEVALRFAALATLACTAGAVGLAALAVDPARRALKGQSAAKGAAALRLLFVWGAGQAGAFCAFTMGWSAYALLTSPSAAVSPFVLSLLSRSAIAGVLAGTLALAPRLTGGLTNDFHLRALLMICLGLAAACIALTSTTSHAAASVAWKPWGSLIDFTHLAAATFWVGSLISLLLLRKLLPGEGSARLQRDVLERFSRVAFFAVGAVLTCGILLFLIQVGSLDRLFTTTYGLLLLGKISLFVPMAALGAHNHYRSIPRFSEMADAALKTVARNVRAEAAMGLVVLLLAGALTAFTPAAAVTAPPTAYILTQKSGDVQVDFQIAPPPAFPGLYTLVFQLWNATTGPPNEVDAGNGTLHIALVNSTLAAQDLDLEGPHGNHYVIASQTFGQPGTWRIDLDILRAGLPDIRATFNIVITPP
jgi:copper transport protein